MERHAESAASPSDEATKRGLPEQEVAITLHAGPGDALMQCSRPGMILRQSAAVFMHNAVATAADGRLELIPAQDGPHRAAGPPG